MQAGRQWNAPLSPRWPVTKRLSRLLPPLLVRLLPIDRFPTCSHPICVRGGFRRIEVSPFMKRKRGNHTDRIIVRSGTDSSLVGNCNSVGARGFTFDRRDARIRRDCNPRGGGRRRRRRRTGGKWNTRNRRSLFRAEISIVSCTPTACPRWDRVARNNVSPLHPRQREPAKLLIRPRVIALLRRKACTAPERSLTRHRPFNVRSRLFSRACYVSAGSNVTWSRTDSRTGVSRERRQRVTSGK